MRNSRGVARIHPKSVLADRKGQSGSILADQSYFRTYSSRSGSFSSRLGSSIDPALQQRLISFDKTTEELFISFTQKQLKELNAFDRQWISEYGYDLEATSHYLDVRNVEAREELQRQNEYLIRSRSRAINSFKKKQKQELQEFYKQRMRERNEIIESNEVEPADTVMSIIRNRSGFQVFPKTMNFSQGNSQINTKTRQIKVDVKKKNSKPSFIFSKTKFEGKDITIGRFKAKKKPKKEEDPDLLDIDNLTRILNAKDGRFQRIKKEKELDETCKIYEFGELNTPSGISSAYISAAGSDSSDELSLQSTRTNGSISVAQSAYDLQVEHFMRQEERTNNEINEFIEKQDALIQMQIQNSHGKKNSVSTNTNKNTIKPKVSLENLHQNAALNSNTYNNKDNDQNNDYEYSNSDNSSHANDNNNQNYNDKQEKSNVKKRNDMHKKEQENEKVYKHTDNEVNDNNDNDNKNVSDNQSPNQLTEMTKSLNKIVDVDVNIFTKGLSSTYSEKSEEYSSDGEQGAHVLIKYPNTEPENSSRVNNSNKFSLSASDYKPKGAKNDGNLTEAKKSRTLGSIPSSITPSSTNYSKKNFAHSQNLKQDEKVRSDDDARRRSTKGDEDDAEVLSSGRIKVHKTHKSKETKEKSFNVGSNLSKKFSNRISNSTYTSSQEKQQFAFRTTLEMGVNSFSTPPIKLDQQMKDD